MMIRSKLAATVVTLSTVVALSLGAGSSSASPDDVRQAADRIMALHYDDFARHPRVTPFDWDTDGCSSPVPVDRLFREACAMHDFGYRNYGRHYRGLNLSPTRETKSWIDGRFLEEMRLICADHYPGKVWCLTSTRVVYEVVSRFGDGGFWTVGPRPSVLGRGVTGIGNTGLSRYHDRPPPLPRS
jgi:phospholipase A2-like protein